MLAKLKSFAQTCYHRYLLSNAAVIIIGYCLLVHFRYQRNKLSYAQMNHYLRNAFRKVNARLKLNYRLLPSEPLNLPKDRCCIFMSNHQSLLDISLIYSLIPGSIRFFLKKDLLKVPLFGKALQQSGMVSLDRSNPKTLQDTFKKIKSGVQKHICWWIFPEGTRSQNGELLNFKCGALRLAKELDAVIIPVGIRGTYKITPTKTYQLNYQHHIGLAIGEIIDTRQYDQINFRTLVDDVKASIQNLVANNEVSA
ncbi:MAG: 1-acyl-sn-glycerol-3-phosphate acyltransferase [Gammaproteobacteria bacterium]|nr:1-acyl-sn-glycerol-3-phosphate acyltransferase [Gammaproteobacteria bacterium]